MCVYVDERTRRHSSSNASMWNVDCRHTRAHRSYSKLKRQDFIFFVVFYTATFSLLQNETSRCAYENPRTHTGTQVSLMYTLNRNKNALRVLYTLAVMVMRYFGTSFCSSFRSSLLFYISNDNNNDARNDVTDFKIFQLLNAKRRKKILKYIIDRVRRALTHSKRENRQSTLKSTGSTDRSLAICVYRVQRWML